jgi:hypothetical protein
MPRTTLTGRIPIPPSRKTSLAAAGRTHQEGQPFFFANYEGFQPEGQTILALCPPLMKEGFLVRRAGPS